MKTYVYNLVSKPELLTDEILAEWPYLRGTQLPDGDYADPLVFVRSAGSNTQIKIDDGIRKAELDAVVAAHDPNAESPAEAYDRRFSEAEGRLRILLRGNPNGPVRVSNLKDLLVYLHMYDNLGV